MNVEPYLYFDGRTEEALEFYKKVLGAEVLALLRFKDSPVAHPPEMVTPDMMDKVMHCHFKIGTSSLMASDGMCQGKSQFSGISLTISLPDIATAETIFTALSEGGQVQMPLTKTFYAERFGMVADQFGVSWMILAVTCP